MRLFAVLLMCLFSLPALAAGDAIKVERASTLARPIEVPTAGVFMIITNDGAEADKLIGVKSNVSDHVMMHSMDVDDKAVMIMRDEKSFDIPANGTLALAPGNNHIMMIDLKTPFDAGTSIPLTLTFEKAGEKTIAVEVISPDKMAKRFPPELSNEIITKKLMETKKRLGKDANEKSSLDVMRERIQNFFRKDKKDDATIDPSQLPSREEMERRSKIDAAPAANMHMHEMPPVDEPTQAPAPAATPAAPAQ